jgi:hypothetical protein|tara:strand:- start:22503 stop:22691 length:189 start_codon:yes stop_codon:yes gene_type:complete
MFDNEHVTKIKVNVPARIFTIYGSDGGSQQLDCPDMEQFMSVWSIAQLATDIDGEIEMVSVI